jgi:hypothetical protein
LRQRRGAASDHTIHMNTGTRCAAGSGLALPGCLLR